MKKFVKDVCPPLLWRGVQRLRNQLTRSTQSMSSKNDQDLDVYWDPEMAKILETWGEGNAWNEIQLLMTNTSGKVLDIACGTGKTMSLFESAPSLEVYGCDISDMLIAKAVERGITRERLQITNATKMNYSDSYFDYGYSIGSLEHFTEEGIGLFLQECFRVIKGNSFHMVPVSASGKDEGWIKTFQSYHNNSPGWWEKKCRAVYPYVEILDSSWKDQISAGKWLVCKKVQ